MQYQNQLPSTSSRNRSAANTVNLAPYFIRLRAMQDARLHQTRREDLLQSTDLPPKYEDIIIGYDNFAAKDDNDNDLPDYNDCVRDTSEREHVTSGDSSRPGRF